MIRVARSHITTRKKCETRRFLTTDINDGGVEPLEGEWVSDRKLAVTRGQLIHSCAELKWRGEDWASNLKQECEKLFAPDVRQLHETLIRRAFLGWLHCRYQYYLDHFDLMSAEKEWEWQVSDLLTIPLRMDKIVRKKDNQLLGIVDFKTMSSISINWVQRMHNDDQTHLYLQALKEKSGEQVCGIAYEGIVLGKWESEDKVQKSPLVSGYQSNKTGKISAKWSAGSQLVSLLDYSDEKWMEWILKQDQLKELYPTTGFILPPNNQLVQTKNATIIGELNHYDKVLQVNEAKSFYGADSLEYNNLIDELFERNSDDCLKYGWGHKCPFYQYCWEYKSLDGFTKRTDHHNVETVDE